jgi:alcohol dehydrogenase (nicotinoprotein)
MSMTTRAAICREPGRPWEITDVRLDEPRANEVRIRFHAAGLCHSDDHIQKGDARMRFPVVGGHEGAGVVEAVGEGVTRVAVGDHVVCSFIPACGSCRYCSTGRQNLCDAGKNASTGEFPDGTFRFHLRDEDLGGLCVLGTFSQRAVVSEFSCIQIPDGIPFEVAALVGCGVPTGWGSAVHAAGVRAGQTVVVYGAGGVGSNAVQGMRARRTWSWWTRWSSIGTRRRCSGPPTRSPTPGRPTTSSWRPPGGSSPTTRSARPAC